MYLMMLTSKNINEYLNSEEKQFKIFNIKYTKEEQDAIDTLNLNTDKIYEYIHFSTFNNLDNLENFIGEIGSNSKDKIIIILNLIKKIIKIVMKGYNKKDYFLIIKTFPPMNDFDIPRWHCDGRQKGFESRDDISKFAIVFKGPGTLFIKTTPEERKSFIEIEKGWENSIDYRKKMEEEIKGSRIQLEKNQGAIFMARTNEDQLNCGIHSEPPLNETRLFLSILPGSKKEITDTMENYKDKNNITLKGGNMNFKDKYLKYKRKYLEIKNKIINYSSQ